MDELIYLLLVENKDEDFVVQCASDTDVQEGDLVEAAIADAVVMGTVTKTLCTRESSAEYNIIKKICNGLPDTLRRVYRNVWEEKDNEDSDSNQTTGAQAGGADDGQQHGQPEPVCGR